MAALRSTEFFFLHRMKVRSLALPVLHAVANAKNCSGPGLGFKQPVRMTVAFASHAAQIRFPSWGPESKTATRRASGKAAGGRILPCGQRLDADQWRACRGRATDALRLHQTSAKDGRLSSEAQDLDSFGRLGGAN